MTYISTINIIFLVYVANVIVIRDVNCANLTFKTTLTSQHPVNFDLRCNYTLNPKKEFFSGFSIYKDSKLFYQFNNKTKSHPTFTKVNGVNKIHNKGPGYFSIENANKTTSGTYECIVYFNKNKEFYAKKLKISITDDMTRPPVPMYVTQKPEPPPKVKLTVAPRVFKTNGSISVYCETQLMTGEQGLIQLALTKDRRVFASVNYLGQRTFDKTDGIKNLTWVQATSNPPRINVRINNATRYTSGMYQCQLTYKNTTTGISFHTMSMQQSIRNISPSIYLSFVILIASIFTIIYNQNNY